MLPDFLCIGVPRAGTTWLYRVLQAHPEAYVPDERKEVHFFDRHYERGLGWYEQFFPATREDPVRAVGEITPQYFFPERCVERIARVPEIRRFILILRNPVDRAYSTYWLRVRVDNYTKPFERFIEERPYAVQWGFYAPRMAAYLDRFDRDRFLILVHEEAMADLAATQRRLAGFLGISEDGFTREAVRSRPNRSFVPRFGAAYSAMTTVARELRDRDMYWLVNLGKKLGLPALMARGREETPEMAVETRRRLEELYRDDVVRLEGLLGRDLDVWGFDRG